jgi:metal-responsive CopG/Arc/MetJ family transcriptional regulator
MAITIHIPKPLLEAIDNRARTLKISRSRLIVQILERELMAEADWSAGFFEQLSAVSPDTASAVDELMTSLR